jgi:hypothetical protein
LARGKRQEARGKRQEKYAPFGEDAHVITHDDLNAIEWILLVVCAFHHCERGGESVIKCCMMLHYALIEVTSRE